MAQTAEVGSIVTKKASKRRARWRKYMPLTIMALPGLLYLLINNYLPMFGIVIAFKDIDISKGILGSDWSGFKNFEYLFKTSDAYIITRNTILYNVAWIILHTVLAIFFAILLNEIKNKFFGRFYQSVILLPQLISIIIVSYLVYAFLSSENGLMNNTILPALGLSELNWYFEKQYWPYILTLVHLWKSVGFYVVVFFAAIIGIDEEYYEAARLDGASKWHQIRFITVPLITPAITMLTLLAIGRIFYSDFGLFYQVPMNSGALFETTSVIDTYVFRGLMGLGDMGMSAAAGFYQSIVGFVLVIGANWIVRKTNKENALF
ncbi:ABC transporter permease subunit [Paenibacillus sp. LHD-117]|uniref:ABC transporter permease n=1 Tax=Paenibacillus sp. LHD-117 TaxID=3071412 RepID=UPI0027E032BE|nr:ABC transporter permease subunit [Paenibacillus sp. LHD-117]MDQ6420174.1 ABC transporter permease subunit [Paenibacillus sp. LHD-117]